MDLIILRTIGGESLHAVAPEDYKLPVSALPVSQAAGNTLTTDEGGLFVPAVDAADILSKLKDCEGNAHAPDNVIPTCPQMNQAIANAIAQLPADNFLSAAEISEDGSTLTLTMSSGEVIEVNLADMIPVSAKDGIQGKGTEKEPLALRLARESAEGLATSGTSLPTKILGERSALLGQPTTFLKVYDDQGRALLVPAFADGN